jgi:EpsD family peptidyl-prolyl cis-trans isomerase
MNIRNSFVFTALLLALALTTGCGKKEEAKVTTQVAARVNSDEITVHQVNYVLARNPNVTPETADQAKREILDKLIDQHLARQKAIKNKLDRTPNVMQAIEAAKSEILARAYLDQVAATLPKPATWETEKYYKEHPELFAQRRLFDLEEIVFVAKGDVATGLREQLSKLRTMQEIANWLQTQEVKFIANRGVRAAEQIPLENLPKVQAMKEGQIQLIDAGDGRFQVLRVVAFKAEPVDEATATPRIQQFLFNRRLGEVMAKEMKQIKEQAKIEYAGEFAGGAAAAEGKVKTEAEANAKAPAEAKSKARVDTQGR